MYVGIIRHWLACRFKLKLVCLTILYVVTKSLPKQDHTYYVKLAIVMDGAVFSYGKLQQSNCQLTSLLS